MPDAVEIPDEVQQQMSEAPPPPAQVEGDPFAVLDGMNEEITPRVEEEPAVEAESVATQPAEEVAAPLPVITHPPGLIERAALLMIPADEVAEMSTAELQRVIKHADRVGQAVADWHTQAKSATPPEPEPAKPAAVDDLAFLDEPDDPKYVNPLKVALAKRDEERRLLLERLEKLEKTHAQSHQQTLHVRLTADLEPEVAKVFDLTTDTGKKKYGELLRKMAVDQKDNTNLSEKQLRARAIKAMEIVPEKPREAAETTVAKKRWADNALAQPSSRKGKESLQDVVARIMAEDQRNPLRGEKRTNGQAAKLPQ